MDSLKPQLERLPPELEQEILQLVRQQSDDPCRQVVLTKREQLNNKRDISVSVINAFLNNYDISEEDEDDPIVWKSFLQDLLDRQTPRQLSATAVAKILLFLYSKPELCTLRGELNKKIELERVSEL